MNHLKTGNAYFAQGSYKSYKYNGKELQETGMYSYGWREYMPDTGRWNGMDQLAEDYLSASPYASVLNNPISLFDPDSRATMAAITAAMWNETPDGSNSYWYNSGNGGFTSYDGGDKGGHAGGGSLMYGSTVSYGGIFTMGDGVYTMPPLILSGYGSSKHWGGAISTYNINHSILYNGISGVQSAWNHSNQPLDPMAWVRSDGPVQWTGSAGDIAGIYDVAGQVISNWEPQNRYLAMGVGIVGGIALKKPGLVAKEESNIWRVGAYNEMRGLEAGLDAHHVGQSAIMKKLVAGYDHKIAPTILVPKLGHTLGTGVVSRSTKGFTSARQVVARDILELRRVYGEQGIPNSALQELIQANKTAFPEAFAWPKRIIP